MDTEKQYICINCGEKVKTLYKKYSASVLKLTECKHCHNIADKYVEYDTVIIIIDLILLRLMAFRHILHNADFKQFWKLSIILVILETYSDWAMFSNHLKKRHNTNNTEIDAKPNLSEVDILLEDFKFYKLCCNTALKTLCFVIVAYLLTKMYTYMMKREIITFLVIWKTVTVSSVGLFLILPSLIWDITAQEFHIHVVALYTTLSQLLAYTAISNCAKIWSLVVIFSSYFCKTLLVDVCNLPK